MAVTSEETIVLHPELRKHLESVGAEIKAHDSGTDVRVPGADSAWRFGNNGSVTRLNDMDLSPFLTQQNRELNRGTDDEYPIRSLMQHTSHGHVAHRGANHSLQVTQGWNDGLTTDATLKTYGPDGIRVIHTDAPIVGTIDRPHTSATHSLSRAALESRDRTPLTMLLDELVDLHGIPHHLQSTNYVREYNQALRR